jgi:hypothetical protein
MFDMYGLVTAHLQPVEKISWEELAARFERPSLLWRILQALIGLARSGASFHPAKACSAPRDRSESAKQCQVPA